VDHSVTEIAGLRVLTCAPEGSVLASESDALVILSESFGSDVEWILIPATRLSDDFFRLRTRLAGLFIQKIVNYQLHAAVVGDISHHLEASSALRDFVRECNEGGHFWFVDSIDAFEARLKSHTG
jgi:uncharacterized protein DUF4180